MNRKFDPDYDGELFSAYLDGAVSSEERTDVERMLAESVVARRYLDDLKRVQQSFQQWHTAKPDAFFLKRVEARIEAEHCRDLGQSVSLKLQKFAVAALVLLTLSGMAFLTHLRQDPQQTDLEAFLHGFLDQDVAQVAVLGDADLSEDLVLDLILTENVR